MTANAMSFTSNIFLIGLLPWLILLAYLLRNVKNSKYILIFLANSIFYVWSGIGAFVFVCLFSLVVWAFASVLQKIKNKLLFGVMICLSALPLILVKYSVFVISNINSLFNIHIGTHGFVVPLGVSFFTFEAISLLSDTFKSVSTKDKINILNVYLYITFFPTVTSGPITRFDIFAAGLTSPVGNTNYYTAVERIITGLCKKVLVADKIAVLADYYFNGLSNGNVLSAAGLWMGSIAYTLQLYFDFSGYSDMAIGIGQLLGFNIPENFNRPYQAKNISDFWKRWHISLTQWFKDYIYIPLGGNRCSVPRHLLNMLVVWLLTGMWHGADWSFIVWGLGYFILLVSEKYLPATQKITSTRLGNIYTLFFVNLLWIPFRAENLHIAQKYILGLFGIGSTGGLEDTAVELLPYTILAVVLCFPLNKLFSRCESQIWFNLAKGVVIMALVFFAVCAVINSSYTPYIYGKF